jgi:diacylglycerol O-acyltransferase 1
LFIAYVIEMAAAYQANGVLARNKKNESQNPTKEDKDRERRELRSTWQLIAFVHAVNATLCLGITTFVVYYYIHHPLIGTMCEMHAIVVWLKNVSYALTNRDLRHARLSQYSPSFLPDLYASCPYPRNITLGNLIYFWWAPTLVYQPVYPRSDWIRWGFLFKRIAEVAALGMFIWIASAQYAVPVLRNSLNKIQSLDIVSILERLMKLSTISLIIWLAGFFALFQSFLNALAEITRFGDREFYTDWWNSPSVGTYWRTWNKPVYSFMKRHIYSPLVARGWGAGPASFMVFFFSAVLHELLVGIPTHNIIGEALVLAENQRNYLTDRFPSM